MSVNAETISKIIVDGPWQELQAVCPLFLGLTGRNAAPDMDVEREQMRVVETDGGRVRLV
jgi:hypothetical protein